jgi:F-type H+-transporting ATPase subunit delta
MASETPKTRVPSVLEDPSAQAVARVYAGAFLDAAGGSVSGSLEEFASFLDDVLGQFPDFNAVLLSGVIGRDEKIRLIDNVVGPYGSPLFVNFLRVLARHDRLDLLPHILRESQVEHERRSNRRRVQVAATPWASSRSSRPASTRRFSAA